MHSIPTNAVAVPLTGANTAAPAGDDALSAMRPAMDTAFAIGRPTDAAGASGILATGASYVSGAAATVAKLDEGIKAREATLAKLDATDPAAAARQREQLDLLQRLRDRVQLSKERVGDILAGKDRSDIGSERGGQTERERIELLARRRALLTPTVDLAAHSAGESREMALQTSAVRAYSTFRD